MSQSPDRAQVEPLAALVAVVAVGLALSLYAGVLEGALPGSPDRNVAGSTIERVESTVAPAGVARPTLLGEASRSGPGGYRVNATLRTDEDSWTAGPQAPGNASRESVRIGVRSGPAAVRPGVLRVVVWS